jgi:hypothetical protein
MDEIFSLPVIWCSSMAPLGMLPPGVDAEEVYPPLLPPGVDAEEVYPSIGLPESCGLSENRSKQAQEGKQERDM